MTWFFITCAALALYVAVSIFFSLRSYPWWLRVLLLLTPVIGGLKLRLLPLIWEGGSFIAPEAPREALLYAGWAYVLLVVLFALFLLRDVLWLIYALLARWCCRVKRRFPYRQATILSLLLGYGLSIWGTYSAIQLPEAKELSIQLDSLPAEHDGLRVVVLADIHATTVNNGAYVEELVRRTNALKPDLVLLPGDMIDGDVELRVDDIAPLAHLEARLGVYACAGNHEYYSGYDAWMAHFRSLGIVMLENDYREVLPGLAVAGVGDPVGGTNFPARKGHEPGVDFKPLEPALRSTCVLLVAHQPIVAQAAALMGVDLQFSGHTHGGMAPLLNDWLIARANGGFVNGLYELNEGRTKLYVSAGAGIWPGFLLRLGVPSEITLIHLRSSRAGQ